MAKQQKKAERISATLATGTKVTAGSQSVIDKVSSGAKLRSEQSASKQKSSK